MANKQSTNEPLRELALFAGAGGGLLASKLLGWRTVCAVERDAYPAQVLSQRQNDGILEPFPIWSDVQSFDGTAWRGLVDVVSGGFPCQDISSAGRGAGIEGAKSSMWNHMARIIGEVRPKYAFVENSQLLVGRGLAVVISDLAEMGYDAVWGVLGAADVGAPHQRDRLWVLAYSNSSQREGGRISSRVHKANPIASCGSGDGLSIQDVANATSERQSRQGKSREQGGSEKNGNRKTAKPEPVGFSQEWPVEPSLGRVADGVDHRMDRLKAIGNGQVPRVAAEAFERLLKIVDSLPNSR